MPVEIWYRWVRLEDVANLAAIDGFGYQERWRCTRISRYLVRRQTAGITAWTKSEGRSVMAGYVLYTVRLKSRQTRIDRLAVLPTERRQGVATGLLEKLLHRCALAECDMLVTMEVPEENLVGHLALRKAGFKAVRVVKGTEGTDLYLFQATSKRQKRPQTSPSVLALEPD